MNLLHTIGLMTRAEHERLIERARDEEQHTIASLKAQLNDARRGFVDQQAKFKRAATDLAAEVKERKKVQYDLARARLEIEDLRPDAEAMRKKRAADRKRMAGKRNG